MSESIDVTLTVNGDRVERRGVDADLPLLDFLHEELGLTGTKFACGMGVCRACTVLLERTAGAAPVPIVSCSTPVSRVNGQAIRTVEGVSGPDGLSPLQQAFLEEFAFQCGYCTPGFLMAAHAMIERLRRAPVPRERLDEAIEGSCNAHLCRCSGYVRYYRAIRKVVSQTPGLVRD